MVISVDTGNKMIKTEHYEFNSGIDVLDTIPGENDEVIEFGGKYYRTTNRRMYCLVYFPTQHLLHLQPVVLKQQIISWLHGARCLEGK